MSSAAFPHLFAPLTIAGTPLRNRIVMLPHGTSMVAAGAPTEEDVAYYVARARQGPGLMVTGAAVSSLDSARRGRKLIEAYNEAVLPQLARRAAAVRAQGAAIVGQVVHLGRESIGMDTDLPLLAPSALRSPRDLAAPREMDEGDIARVIDDFARSARHLEQTGHDGVEIHGAHGYLVAQFLSPATNRRSDRWGGDAPRRLRFLAAVIDAIRAACTPGFILGLRLSADEEIADGLEPRDTRAIVAALARDHPVDYLSVTVGTRGGYVKDVTQPVAPARRAAALLREASGFVTVVGQRVTTPTVAEQILAACDADAVGFARAFVADAGWVAKAAAGEGGRIRPCIGLNQDCRAFAPHLHCAANPLAGRETDPQLLARAAARRKRVAVVGGGPAGLEAARIAAERGHEVVLYEASETLGGQFSYAAAVPGRSDLLRLIDHLRGEVSAAGVPIRFDRRIERPDDLDHPADEVVFATGATPGELGSDLAAAGALCWLDVLQAGAPAPRGSGQAVVQDDGTGFWWTYGVANALVDAGWSVTLVTPSATIAGAIPAESLPPLLVRLGDTCFRLLSTVVAARTGEVDVTSVTSGREETLAADLLVVQTGRGAVSPSAAAFTAAGMAVHRVGDCVAPRRVSNALLDAQRLAKRL